jgi:hypothetical protein
MYWRKDIRNNAYQESSFEGKLTRIKFDLSNLYIMTRLYRNLFFPHTLTTQNCTGKTHFGIFARF